MQVGTCTPDDNASHEQMHRTFKADPKTCRTLAGPQKTGPLPGETLSHGASADEGYGQH